MSSQVSSNPTKSETYGLGVKNASRCHKLLSRPIDFPNCQVYVFTPMYSKCSLFCAEAVVTLVGIRRPIYPTAVARQTLAICVILIPGGRIITNFSVWEL